MKRVFAGLLTLVMVVTLFSCTTTSNDKTKKDAGIQQIANQYAQPFETTANIRYNDTVVRMNLEKLDDGSTQVTLSEPAMLKGMTFTVSDEVITVGYMGMKFDIDPNNLSSSLIVSTVVNTFNSLASGSGITATVKNDTLQVVGNTETANFLLTLDKKTGNALSLDIPSMGLSAEFENFKRND